MKPMQTGIHTSGCGVPKLAFWIFWLGGVARVTDFVSVTQLAIFVKSRGGAELVIALLFLSFLYAYNYCYV